MDKIAKKNGEKKEKKMLGEKKMKLRENTFLMNLYILKNKKWKYNLVRMSVNFVKNLTQFQDSTL